MIVGQFDSSGVPYIRDIQVIYFWQQKKKIFFIFRQFLVESIQKKNTLTLSYMYVLNYLLYTKKNSENFKILGYK